MSVIVVGFYGEGPTDYRFLQPLSMRLIENLIPHHDLVPQDIPLNQSGLDQVEKMVYVAQKGYGYSFICFHLDADGRDIHLAQEQRFIPGLQQVLTLPEANHNLVPVIPIKMTEAWMLADINAFREVLSTTLTAQDLDFPNQPRSVESILNPKETLAQAIQLTRPGRQNPPSVADISLPLAERIDLQILRRVPSFQKFEDDIADMLNHLRLI